MLRNVNRNLNIANISLKNLLNYLYVVEERAATAEDNVTVVDPQQSPPPPLLDYILSIPLLAIINISLIYLGDEVFDESRAMISDEDDDDDDDGGEDEEEETDDLDKYFK